MVHLIITTANILESYEKRKEQYIESIESCLKYAHLFDSYAVLECVSQGDEYLDRYNTFYSKEPNQYLNKGLNEVSHLQAYLEQSALPDDRMIIKLSGRYLIEESYFFEKVTSLQHDFDSIFKNDNDVFEGNGYHTFFYAIKKGLFLDIAGQIDFSANNEKPIEWDFKEHLMTNERHIEIDRLGLMARQGTNAEKTFRC